MTSIYEIFPNLYRTLICKNCGNKNVPGYVYCDKCGELRRPDVFHRNYVEISSKKKASK